MFSIMDVEHDGIRMPVIQSSRKLEPSKVHAGASREALGHTVLLTLVYVLSIWNRLWKGCLESECHVRMSVIINVYKRHLAASHVT